MSIFRIALTELFLVGLVLAVCLLNKFGYQIIAGAFRAALVYELLFGVSLYLGIKMIQTSKKF